MNHAASPPSAESDLSESTSALGELPLVLIPCFAVPLWICLHIAALTQIAASGQAARH